MPLPSDSDFEAHVGFCQNILSKDKIFCQQTKYYDKTQVYDFHTLIRGSQPAYPNHAKVDRMKLICSRVFQLIHSLRSFLRLLSVFSSFGLVEVAEGTGRLVWTQGSCSFHRVILSISIMDVEAPAPHDGGASCFK